jgi:hypothetical protein
MLKDGDKRPESIAAPSIADAKPRRGHSKKFERQNRMAQTVS